ncbi:MAG: hypothetical protein ILO68_06385, partial [Clostridia bacterium]|nr:hypothetical protein [Clostridia bacterium]
QVCSHIGKSEQTGKAVVFGMGLNAVLTLGFSFASILGSKTVTEIATVGLSDGIGIPFVKILCAVLVAGAMLTSFWSIGFAFADVAGSRLRFGPKISWFVVTLPAVLIAVLVPLSVLDYVQIGAGALSILFLLVVFPAYKHAVKEPIRPPLLGKLSGNMVLIVLVAVGTVLMAISSFVPVD